MIAPATNGLWTTQTQDSTVAAARDFAGFQRKSVTRTKISGVFLQRLLWVGCSPSWTGGRRPR